MNLATAVVSLERKPLYFLLFVPIVVLIAIGAARFAYIYNLGTVPLALTAWADIGGEGSVVMWWTSLLWSFAALLCLLEFDRNATKLRYYWLALAVGSLLLSLDESVQIHESFSTPAGNFFGNPGGAFAASWVLAAIPIVVVCLVILTPFLGALPRRTAACLFLSGTIFVGGAVGMEMVFAYVSVNSPESWWLILTLVCIEESLEMIGAALFCTTVYAHLGLSLSSAA